ncbi:hypothetical protein SDC64_03000 [Acinetobacter haemolyticus]|uniref:hypothetical protein n=1 Tax=Acinetobacter haemolyticus TaxID=29430 RepID=UPI002A6A27C4|nr:hypothetical protein [Acinetobacter haemolyticus]WPO67920.1 hypothetical protein SDC64_03000 [Acinetobacter haemolyticus]
MAKIKLNNRQDKQIELDVHQLNHYANIVEIQTWNELVDCYLLIKQQVSPKKVFLILDYASQAEYTSMHAIEDERLYLDIHQYLDHIDVNDPTYEQVYQNVCLLKEFRHYIRQLSSVENQQAFESLVGKMQHYDREDFQTLLYLNQNPLAAMDKEIVVKVAQVETEALKLAMMPNGYFSCDFDPFENFSIIQRIQQYGFEFIGLGAVLLGWIKTSAFKDENIHDLIKDLTHLYHLDLTTQKQMAILILKNDYLILSYSESPKEYLDYYV